MTDEFDQRRKAPYPQKDPIDAEALRFVKSWHRCPELHDVLWYKGVNLGEMDEYNLLPLVITALLDAREHPGR